MEAKLSVLNSKKTLNAGGRLIDLSIPKVMGILNITPDSFYAGSRVQQSESPGSIAARMMAVGADILDVGGYSSRPGADHISIAEELDRVLPAIEEILEVNSGAVISIDTFRSEVAEKALEYGALIVNDISGGSLDERMIEVVVERKVPYIMMHMRGTPQTMKELTEYDDLIQELIDYFNEKIELLRDRGLRDIVIDPGFGFAKNRTQNFRLLKDLARLQILDEPLLVGLSRKSMIFKTLDITPAEALNGSTALHMAALLQGASILRVHDVREAVETVKLYNTLTT